MKTKTLIASVGLLLTAHTLTAAVTYRIYATREGLVGNKTANGHIIQSRDHFVALPSSQPLNCLGCRTYTVTLQNPANGRTSSNQPVWDVGPWNTKDNYWHLPRLMWTDLARGLPEAQAAYQNGYNGGRDEFGRTVANPAGIDLADGTFWDDLGMVGNGWINVTFNWESSPAASVTMDNSGAGFSVTGTWSTGTGSTDKFGTDYRYHGTQAISEPAQWVANITGGTHSVYAWWPQGSNRSTTAPYVVYHGSTSTTVNKNQQINGGVWNLLGTWGDFVSGNNTVKLSCWTTTGYVVMADAIKWQ